MAKICIDLSKRVEINKFNTGWLYRRLVLNSFKQIDCAISKLYYQLRAYCVGELSSIIPLLAIYHDSHDLLARNWPARSVVLYVAFFIRTRCDFVLLLTGKALIIKYYYMLYLQTDLVYL